MCAKDKMEDKFKLTAPFGLSGDQPQAVEKLVRGFLEKDGTHQTLLGVTGSGKTFTMANVIARLNRPTLVLAHNKTLAAQLYSEFKEFFPENSVNYFVSYYDYYQPEAYIPASDVYIEKDASVNERIEKLRLMTTKALLERRDVVVGRERLVHLRTRQAQELRGRDFPLRLRRALGAARLHDEAARELLRAQRYDARPRYVQKPRRDDGDIPLVQRHGAAHILLRRRDRAHRRDRPGQRQQRDAQGEGGHFPSKHYITSPDAIKNAAGAIEKEMEECCARFTSEGKYLEEERLRMRTKYDLEMLLEVGYCSGIENYSRYLDGREAGDPPGTLLDFFPKDALFFIDESHMTLPQVRGMYNGDRARKEILVAHGFPPAVVPRQQAAEMGRVRAGAEKRALHLRDARRL